MKKWILLFTLLISSLVLFSPSKVEASPHQQVQLMINGSIEEPEVPPKIFNDRTFVPLRLISEKMGADVNWFPETKEIHITRGEQLLELELGNPEILVNGLSEKMDIAPYVEQGRTLVPIRFVSRYLGLNVGWEEKERLVIVSEPIHVYVEGELLNVENSSLYYHQQIYLPIFKVSELLQINVHRIAEEMITIDGVEMAPFEWVDPLLGTTSTWDIEENTVYINAENSNEQNEATDQNNLEEGYDQREKDRPAIIDQVLDFVQEANVFRIHLSEGQVEPVHFFLESPLRLVVDLPYTILADGKFPADEAGVHILYVDHETVEQVRLSQFSNSPHTVRLVFDLNQRSRVALHREKQELEIHVEKRIPLIVIDAGHGGSDPGASGEYSLEKDITLDVALKIIQLLELDSEVGVIATRVDDTYPTLDERVELANQIEADIFVSVHANAFNNKPTIRGTETYIYPDVDKTLGKIMHKHLIEATGLTDRGLKEGNYKVLRETKMPAVLIEMAFISNAYEEQLLNDPEFQDKVALAVYNALKEYEIGKWIENE